MTSSDASNLVLEGYKTKFHDSFGLPYSIIKPGSNVGILVELVEGIKYLNDYATHLGWRRGRRW